MEVVLSKTSVTSTVVKGSPGLLFGVVLAAGTDNGTVVIHDNATEASGTVLVKLAAVLATSEVAVFPHPIVASKGIYADIAGTVPLVAVLYI